MLVKRVIPCLDVKEGRVVKGVRFLKLKDAGDSQPLLTSNMRWIRPMQSGSAWIWMISWFLNRVPAKKRCEFARP